MKLCWLFLAACMTIAAADAPRVTFSKSFPGSAPAFFAITVEQSGAATYNESEDPDNVEKITLEPHVTARIFELSEQLDHFKKPLESPLKVANMGMKTMRWESGGENSEAKFNYSASEEAKALADIFERISESERMMLELNRAIRHDRLGVNDATLRIEAAWNGKRLMATPSLLPLLDQVAANEAFVHIARQRAAKVSEAIRASVQ